jgi:hypothetical protein
MHKDAPMGHINPRLPDDLEMDRMSDAAVKIYDDQLKSVLEPSENGKTVAIDIDTGDYSVARRSSTASRDLRSRRPNGRIVTMLIGPDQMDQLAVRMLAANILAGAPK